MKTLKHLAILAFLLSLSTSTYAQINLDYLLGSSKDYSAVKVRKVFTADSFELLDGEKIRLIGLRSPAPPKQAHKEIERDRHGFPIKKPINTEKSVEEQSFQYLVQLIEQKKIRLEFDNRKKDDQFYTYAYAFLKDGTFINTEVLRLGYAHLKTTPTNKKYIKELRTAYQESRHEMRGLQSY
ncbi:MAG: micrococcal nuclease [Lysobacterales bacterium]|jgi:micrococcal nuclease